MLHESVNHWQADVVVAAAVAPVVLLPLAVGGVHPEVQAAFAVVELLCALAWVALAAAQRRPLYAPYTALPLALGVVVTALEVLPLPSSLLALVAPHTVETRAFVVSALPAALQTQVLSVVSMDPPETKAALLRLVGALALAFVIANGARRRERARLIWRMLVAGAAIVLLVRAVYGLGVVRYDTGDLIGPLVNANHTSKVLGAFSLLALARATTCRSPLERGFSLAVAAAASVSVILTMSRGGIAAWCVGAMVAAAVPRLHSSGSRRFVVVVAASIGVAALGIALAPRVVDEMHSIATDLGAPQRSKLALWQPAVTLAIQLMPCGTGNGSFGAGFSGQSAANTINAAELTFSHVENIVLAPLVEHGVFAGAVMLTVALVVGVRLVRQRGRALAVLPALAVLVVGDLFDFALELPAGLALVAVILGLGAADGLSERATPRPPLVLALGSVACAVVVVIVAPEAVREWRYRADALVAATHNPVQRRALLEHSLAVRPFDAVRCTELAIDARHRRQPREALAWANRAINLWPVLPVAHIEAARALVVVGHLEQAMLEYREAATSASDQHRVLHEAFARSPLLALRRRAVPDNAAALASLCALLRTEGRLVDASACAHELVARPDASAAQRLEALHVALALHDRVALKKLVEQHDDDVVSGDASVLRARAIKELDGAEQALLTSASWPASRELAQWRLNEQLQANSLVDALATAEGMQALITSSADRDRLDRTIADLHGKRGDHGKRLLVLRSLSRRHPDDVNVLADIGLCQLELGEDAGAVSTLRRLRALGKTTPRTRALAQALGQTTDE